MIEVPRYWFLKDNLPTGPETLADLHAQIAAGNLTWQTKVCRTGETNWVTLLELSTGGSAAVTAPALPADPTVPISQPHVKAGPVNTLPPSDPSLQSSPHRNRFSNATLLGILTALIFSAVEFEWGKYILPSVFGATRGMKMKHLLETIPPKAIDTGEGQVTRISNQEGWIQITVAISKPVNGVINVFVTSESMFGLKEGDRVKIYLTAEDEVLLEEIP